jgi:hypothetical protein
MYHPISDLHVVVIMFTDYLVGYAVFKTLFSNSHVPVTAKSIRLLDPVFLACNPILCFFIWEHPTDDSVLLRVEIERKK